MARRNRNKNKGKGKLKEKITFAALTPLKPAMVAALKASGEKVSLSDSMSKIAPRFYARLIKKSSNFEYEKDNLDPVTITAIVSGILTWFRKKKEQKDNGEPLSPAEEKAVGLGEQAAEELNKIKKEETQQAIGANFIYILIALFIILFLMKK